MRSAAEIRTGILRIRDKNKLPLTIIAERSRCSRDELISAFTFDASENTLRRLDAYLDAPKLHRRKRGTSLIYKVERLSGELWKEYRVKTWHPNRVQDASRDELERYWGLINYIGKQELQRKMLKDHSLVVKVPDGEPYWLYKERCIRRLARSEAVRTGNRNTDRFPWPCPVAQVR